MVKPMGRDTGDVPAMAAVVLLIGLFGRCQGLTYPLLSLILERRGPIRRSSG